MPTLQSTAAVPQPFKPIDENGLKGMSGPFGQVQVFTLGDRVLPVKVATKGRTAVMDLTGRSALVRYGSGASAVELSTKGVRLGTAGTRPWNDDTVRKLIAALAGDRKLAASAMLLRSTLHTAYPAALTQRQAPGKSSMGAAMKRGAQSYGRSGMRCSSQTVTDVVTKYITETVEVIRTAAEQWEQCYDREVGRSPCAQAPLAELRSLCAAGVCAMQSFEDIVAGFHEVVTAVADEVTRVVVKCVAPKPGNWPSPWALSGIDFPGAVPQARAQFSPAELKDAKALVKNLGGFFGPFAKCLVGGEWSFTQLETPLDLGGGRIVVPYGVRVRLNAACAKTLTADQIWSETLSAWGSGLAALAALSPAFAASTGIAPAVGAAAIVAGASTAVVAAAALILAFIMLALIYGTAIAGQLQFHQWAGSFDDGFVNIEHPTFALALIKLATLSLVPAELIPPIVTG